MQKIYEFMVNHSLLSSAFLVTLALIIYTEIRRRLNVAKEITPATAVRLMNDESALALDIRSDAEYRAGHLLKAKNLPLKDLASRTHELNKYFNKPVIIYCASGLQSAKASALLHKAGFSNLYSLAGGLQAWDKAGLPTENK